MFPDPPGFVAASIGLAGSSGHCRGVPEQLEQVAAGAAKRPSPVFHAQPPQQELSEALGPLVQRAHLRPAPVRSGQKARI